MAEYFLPVFIFITTGFVLCLLLNSSDKFSGYACFLGSVLFFYIIYRMANSSSGSPEIFLSIIFSVEFILFVVLLFKRRKIVNLKVVSISYSILLLLVFLIARGYYRDDENRKSWKEAKDNEISEFKGQYDFNVDSLVLTPPITIDSILDTSKMKFPIIVYNKRDNEISFDYDFNKSLGRNLTTFTYDSLNTIVIIENEVIEIGTYSNGITKAQRIETKIQLFNKKTLSEISHLCY
jgi:positive regulator of sigma E activity